MTDQSDMTKGGISRRSLLKGAPLLAGVVVSAAALPRAALAQEKLSHTVAKYQEAPKDGQKCSTCAVFVPPAHCKIVADPINPDGWCQFYSAKN